MEVSHTKCVMMIQMRQIGSKGQRNNNCDLKSNLINNITTDDTTVIYLRADVEVKAEKLHVQYSTVLTFESDHQDI